MKFRKKPVVVDAIQWIGTNGGEITDFMNGSANFNSLNEVVINTLEGFLSGSINDWIIKGVKGEFYPCKPDIFEATYEAVE